MAESKQEQTTKTTEQRKPDGSQSVDTEKKVETQQPQPEPAGHAQTGASEARDRSMAERQA